METRASPSLCRFSDRRATSSLDATGSRREGKRDPPQQRARLKRAQSHESRAIDPFGNPTESENFEHRARWLSL